MHRRRALLAGAGACLWPGAQAADAGLDAALRRAPDEGGVVMLRHALAPGTFDPPGFQLGDCSTQRNLSDEGRQQARQIGAWFTARGLRPRRVRSSPWCRCLDTARLAFGPSAEAWPALGSPRGTPESTHPQALAELREALAAVVARRAGFEVWVTHMFVFAALLEGDARSPSSGEGALLGVDATGAPRVLTRLTRLTG